MTIPGIHTKELRIWSVMLVGASAKETPSHRRNEKSCATDKDSAPILIVADHAGSIFKEMLHGKAISL